ncbi:phage tail assembly chaperone [Sphingomonas sp. LY54]|uniref:phage tail assembly chaperone n=1 Tax=Sphingomonadales TaxID=204457 RepID=UPI002ADEE9CE|nr:MULTISPECIES: phage tail assembly chaperone [Sphingomonadales]MEA1014812.1 phage tail assembly chaperone [Sphingosinicella sp. LY1275]WRP29545.1 phage tail assembly chaperone [Sphingomonas sp. LY54]
MTEPAATFANSAARWAGLAGLLLGWRPEEFWRSTPAELAAIVSAMRGQEPPTASRAEMERLQEMFPDG